jgi:hypothetical protein
MREVEAFTNALTEIGKNSANLKSYNLNFVLLLAKSKFANFLKFSGGPNPANRTGNGGPTLHGEHRPRGELHKGPAASGGCMSAALQSVGQHDGSFC